MSEVERLRGWVRLLEKTHKQNMETIDALHDERRQLNDEIERLQGIIADLNGELAVASLCHEIVEKRAALGEGK